MGCLVGHLFRCFLACGHGLECLLDLEPPRFRGLQRRRRHGEGEEQGDELGRGHVELQGGLGTRTMLCYGALPGLCVGIVGLAFNL